MYMKFYLILIISLADWPSICLAKTNLKSTSKKEIDLKLTIMDQTVKRGETFQGVANMINKSKNNIRYALSVCPPGTHWKSSNLNLKVSEKKVIINDSNKMTVTTNAGRNLENLALGCSKPFGVSGELKPGEELRRELLLHVNKNASPGKLRFHIIFQGYKNIDSNEVDITII